MVDEVVAAAERVEQLEMGEGFHFKIIRSDSMNRSEISGYAGNRTRSTGPEKSQLIQKKIAWQLFLNRLSPLIEKHYAANKCQSSKISTHITLKDAFFEIAHVHLLPRDTFPAAAVGDVQALAVTISRTSCFS